MISIVVFPISRLTIETTMSTRHHQMSRKPESEDEPCDLRMTMAKRGKGPHRWFEVVCCVLLLGNVRHKAHAVSNSNYKILHQHSPARMDPFSVSLHGPLMVTAFNSQAIRHSRRQRNEQWFDTMSDRERSCSSFVQCWAKTWSEYDEAKDHVTRHRRSMNNPSQRQSFLFPRAVALGAIPSSSSASSSASFFQRSSSSKRSTSSSGSSSQSLDGLNHNRTSVKGGGWRRFLSWTSFLHVGNRATRTATAAHPSLIEPIAKERGRNQKQPNTVAGWRTTSATDTVVTTDQNQSLSAFPSSTSLSPSSETTDSVHLKLNGNGTCDEEDARNGGPEMEMEKNVTTIKVHSYIHPQTGKTWKAVNTPKTKFLAFLEYNKLLSGRRRSSQQNSTKPEPIILTKEFQFTNPSSHNDEVDNPVYYRRIALEQEKQERLRVEWRKLWKQGRLLTDRTEFLAVYPSDTHKHRGQKRRGLPTRSNRNGTAVKRGGFTDLLHLYCERLVAVLEDELNDEKKDLHEIPTTNTNKQQHDPRRMWLTSGPSLLTTSSTSVQVAPQKTSSALLSWLEEHYGSEATKSLMAQNLHSLPEAQQLATFKHFLEWFRSYFPYYYDRCGVCGASIKEDLAAHPLPTPTTTEANEEDEETSPQGPQQQTFVGYIYPGRDELEGKASRTELYQCHKCHEFTRFPRFNSAWHVMESRRGRCGEYSMLLFRFLRVLGHEARWVVDWADHVWAEVFVYKNGHDAETRDPAGRWVHLDPCEAAVDENLIYQGWGKKQTYIVAFYAPNQRHGSLDVPSSSILHEFPLIEDVTSTYTSDDASTIQQRRDESPEQVRTSVEQALEHLQTHPRLFGNGIQSK